MKALLTYLAAFLILIPLHGEVPIGDIALIDGSHIKGKIMSSNGSEVTILSNLGLVRVKLDKLTPDAREKVASATKPDPHDLERRIAELEAKLMQLQQENETLRKQILASNSPSDRGSGPSSPTPSAPPTVEGGKALQHSMSSSGKRHNSNCRYFSSAKICKPAEGEPCKICGG